MAWNAVARSLYWHCRARGSKGSGFGGAVHPPRWRNSGLQRFSRSVFLLFRATALARIAALYPARAEEFGPRACATLDLFAAVNAAKPASNALALVNNSAFAAIRTYAMAFSAARVDRDAYSAAFAAASVDEAAASAVFAATAAAKVAHFTGREISSAVSQDALFVVQGGGESALASRPLWPGGMPDWAADNWRQLKEVLPANEHWEVWTRWYDDRLAGRVYREPAELAFVTDSLGAAAIPGEAPEVDPVEANKWIAGQLEGIDSTFPPGGPAAT